MYKCCISFYLLATLDCFKQKLKRLWQLQGFKNLGTGLCLDLPRQNLYKGETCYKRFLVLLSSFFSIGATFLSKVLQQGSLCLLSRLGRLLSSILVLDAFAKPAWTTIGSALLSRGFPLEDVNGCSCKVREAALELRLPLFPSLTSRHNGVSLDAKLNGFRTDVNIVIHQLAYPIVQAPLGFPFLATLLPGEAD
jgi:hypothetical protein